MQPTVTRRTSRALEDFARADVRPVIAPWIVARLLVGAGLALARYLFTQIGSGPRPDPLRQGFLAWDASFYRDIAAHGYGAVGRSGLRFFPLVPMAARGLGPILGGNTGVALLIITNAAALIFAALLHRLVMRETNDPGIARRAVWFAMLLPPTMVLTLGYAESVFLALAVGMFLCLRTDRWGAAATVGVLAGVCRPVGILLVVPAAIEAARGFRDTGTLDRCRRALAVAAPAVGTGIFLTWVGFTRDDWLLPFRVQPSPTLRGGFSDPITSVVNAFGNLTGDRFGSGLHLAWAAVFVVLIVAVGRRLPASYTAYAAAAALLALTAHNLDSFERYGVATFPIVIGAALITNRRELETSALTLSAGAMVGYSTLVFLGRYVP